MKREIFKIYGFLHTLKYPKVLHASLRSIFDQNVLDKREALRRSADWLLFMQNSDGGYSRKFSFIDGRDSSYIETTGYIIPTLLEVSRFLEDRRYKESAFLAGKWLLKVQNRDGSFSEIDTGKPYAFDTGQCLIGLNALYEETKDRRYLLAAERAAYWLMKNQEDDGSWMKVAYHGEKHTYYTRVAAAMLKYASLSKDEEVRKSAQRHITWVLEQQQDSGFFKYSSFLESVPAYLHTLMYVLEGLLDAYALTEEPRLLESVIKNADKFKAINLQRDLVLCSQYDERFECVNQERCLTGLAQWAGVAWRLYQLTKDAQYKRCAVTTIFYLKAKQIKSSEMDGGYTASIPFWGRYGGFDFVNWSNKFFIDALLLHEDLKIEQEQEAFVESAFGIGSSVVTSELSFMDRAYLAKIVQVLPKKRKIKVLDLGCGKGVIIYELQKQFEDIEFFGIDPVFEGENILRGSAYDIPFESGFFDMVMSFEVLQHTYIERALGEIYRVLKPKGKLIIGERDAVSILGLLKPWYEVRGRWMYPYDAPFRERWYTKSRWREILDTNGFEVERIFSIQGDGKPFVNRYIFIEGSRHE